MRIRCEKCNEKFDIEETDGLCPKCSFYNTPISTTPDLDEPKKFVIDYNNDVPDDSEDVTDDSDEVTSEKNRSIADNIVRGLAILYFIFAVLKMFLGTMVETPPMPSQEAPFTQIPSVPIPTAPSVSIPTAPYTPSFSDKVVEEEEVEYVDDDEASEVAFTDIEETLEKCELPVNVIIDGTTVTGYTTTPNLISNVAVIPEGVTEIGDYAFDGCDDLEFLMLSNGVERIGKYAFANLPNLKYIYLLSQDLKVIDDYAFYGVTADVIDFPSTVEYIGDYAMYGMNVVESLGEQTKLGLNAIRHEYDKKLVVDDAQITNGVLVRCVSEDSHYDVPSDVTMINTNAFMGCNIESITLPEGLVYIGANAFYGCNLTEIAFPSSLEIIEDYAFQNSKKLEKVEFNEGLVSIGNKSFSECKNLAYVNIPKSLNYMTLETFSYSIWADEIKPTDGRDWIINNILLETKSDTTETFVLQSGIEYVGSFSINGHIQTPSEIVFPKETKGIEKNAVNIPHQTPIWLNIPSSVEYISDDLIPYSELDFDMIMIKCDENSYAHKFAIQNGIHFVLN